MSKVLSSTDNKQCTAWQAPHFAQSEANALGCNNQGYNNGDRALLTKEQQLALQQKGFDEAFAKGYSEGKALAQQDVNARVNDLSNVLNAMQAPFAELDDKVVDEMVELCMAVVKQIVRRELKMSPDEIVAVVREALKLLPVANGDVKLELNPDDAKIVREALLASSGASSSEQSSSHHASHQAWQIIEDPIISRGGCRVFTQTSRIDATVENRLNATIAGIMGGERNLDQSE